jgi:hypothetical protein
MRFRLVLAAVLLFFVGACAQIGAQSPQDFLPDRGPPVVNGFYDLDSSCPDGGCGDARADGPSSFVTAHIPTRR